MAELTKQIEEVLAITKKRTTRSPISGVMDVTNLVIIEEIAPIPSHGLLWNRGRGRGQTRFMSRRAGFQRNFGPGRARPMFQRYSQNAMEDYGDSYHDQQGYEDYGNYNHLPEYDVNYGSGNKYWGGQ